MNRQRFLGQYSDRITSFRFYLFLFLIALLVIIPSSIAPKPAEATTVRFAAFGDYGTNDANELTVKNLVYSWNPDFIITTGDNSYGSTAIDDNIGKYYSDYIGNYVGSYGSGSATDHFFPAMGNHDYTDGGQSAAYFSYFTLPPAPGDERYYDFVQGPVHFFVIDSNIAGIGDLPAPGDGRSDTSAQAVWLQGALAGSTSPWKIVYMHHPPFSSSSSHGSEEEMQWPYEDWGATAVFAGHDHVYERIIRDDNSDGVDFGYFTTGAGGRSLYGFGTPLAGSEVRYNANYGSMRVEATDTSITYEFWSVAGGGTLIDSYTMTNTGSLTCEDFETGWADHTRIDDGAQPSGAEWFAASGPYVENDFGVGGTWGLDNSGNIFIWTDKPFSWVDPSTSDVVMQMDFQTDGTAAGGLFDDDRVGWQTKNNDKSSNYIFGVQLDDYGGHHRLEGYWDHVYESGDDAGRVEMADLDGIVLDTNAFYRLWVEFTKLTDTSAEIDAQLWSLDVSGNPLSMIASGTITDTSVLGTLTPASEYFETATLHPAYKNHTGNAGHADNACAEVLTSSPGQPENWVAYNDLNGIIGDNNATNVTRLDYAAVDEALMDFASGQDLTATMTGIIVNDYDPKTGNGGQTNAGTEAGDTFGPAGSEIVDLVRGIELDFPDWDNIVEFNDLDPDKEYIISLTANRNEPTYTGRWTRVTIEGADSFVNASSSGVSVADPGNFETQASVSFNTGYNYLNGYVAKWTNITTGQDGSFSIKSEREDGFGASGTEKGYAMSAFKLEQVDPAPPPANWIAYNDLNGIIGDNNATNVTRHDYAAADEALMDFASGQDLTATMTGIIVNDYDPKTGNGGQTNAGTEAGDTFGPAGSEIVDLVRGIELDFPDWDNIVEFNDLDPDKEYIISLTANRNDPTYTGRWTRVTIEGADSFVNASSSGVSVADPGNFETQASVSFNTGYNYLNGYVAKWTNITTGQDGSFSIKSEREDGFGASGTEKGYAMSAFKLEQVDPAPPATGWTAYNDVVFDATQEGASTDPNGQSVHYIATNVMTYSIGTNSPGPSSGELVDFATGDPTGVTAALTQSGGVVWQPDVTTNWYGGYDTAAGTDAHTTFNGIADMTGVVYYGSVGWSVDLTLTGLDPAAQYTFATSASRANPGYTDRYSIYTISDVASAVNSSTVGTQEYEGDPHSIWFNTGDNHDDGFVARWTDIQSGVNGSFTVRAEAHPSANSGYKAYAFDVFMLEQQGGAPPVQYDLTILYDGNGTVDLAPPGGTYDEGSIVQMTANPEPDWTFDGWSGDISSGNNPESITMDANKTVTATFMMEPVPENWTSYIDLRAEAGDNNHANVLPSTTVP